MLPPCLQSACSEAMQGTLMTSQPQGRSEAHPTHRSSTSHAFLSLSSSCLVQPAAAFSFSAPFTIRSTSLPPCGVCSFLSSTDATALHHDDHPVMC